MNYSLNSLVTTQNLGYGGSITMNHCAFSRLLFPLFVSSISARSSRCTFSQLASPVFLSSSGYRTQITTQQTSFGLFEDCVFSKITSDYTFYSKTKDIELSLIRCGVVKCNKVRFLQVYGKVLTMSMVCFRDCTVSGCLYGDVSFRDTEIQSVNHFDHIVVSGCSEGSCGYGGGNKEFSFKNGNITKSTTTSGRCAFCFTNAPADCHACKFNTASNISGTAMTGFWCSNPFYIDHLNYLNITSQKFMESGLYESVVTMEDCVFIGCSFSLSLHIWEQGSIKMEFSNCFFTNEKLNSTEEFTFGESCSFGSAARTHSIEWFNQGVCFRRGETQEFTQSADLPNSITILLLMLALVNFV